jgi:hypothetical protein
MTQSKLTMDPVGTKVWRNEQGVIHRLDEYAVEYINGTKAWCLNGSYHRLDGPAIEAYDGSKEWWVNGLRHREDGPAVEWINGHKEWWLNNRLHRLDGPAVVHADGDSLYYVDNKHYSRRNFPIGVIQFLLNCNEKTAQLILDVLNDTV